MAKCRLFSTALDFLGHGTRVLIRWEGQSIKTAHVFWHRMPAFCVQADMLCSNVEWPGSAAARMVRLWLRPMRLPCRSIRIVGTGLMTLKGQSPSKKILSKDTLCLRPFYHC